MHERSILLTYGNRGCGNISSLETNGGGVKKKNGRPSKWGEPTLLRTVRVPESVDEQLPEPKGEAIANILVEKFNPDLLKKDDRI